MSDAELRLNDDRANASARPLRALVLAHVLVPVVLIPVALGAKGPEFAVFGNFTAALAFAQYMLLCFWVGMGRSRRFMRIALCGATFLALWQVAGTWLYIAVASGGRIGPAEVALTVLVPIVIYNLAVAVGSAVFVVLGVHWAELRWFADPGQLPAAHSQFSIRQMMTLVLAAAIMLGLLRLVDFANLSAFTVFLFLSLYFVAIVAVAIGSVWATLSVGPPAWRIALAFFVALFLGMAIVMTAEKSPDAEKLWQSWILLLPTAIVIASLLVVRSCGYRLVRTAGTTRAQ